MTRQSFLHWLLLAAIISPMHQAAADQAIAPLPVPPPVASAAPAQAAPPPAENEAGNPGRFSIISENDYYVSPDDKHYTNGVRIAYLSGRVTPDGFWDGAFNGLSRTGLIFDGTEAHKRKYGFHLGQSMFTPNDTQSVVAPERDRPYAAWLYGGVNMLQETRHDSHDTLENFELEGGVIGRWALGGVTQNDFHQFIGVDQAKGWRNELKNEPGIMLTYERKWRFQQPLYGNLAIDAIPELGGTAGNIMTYGQASLLLRFGQNLKADYGPSRIRPSLSGTDWFDADRLDGQFGWYIYAGAQGRAVARNIFLDGNSFVNSPHVNKKPLVADLVTGAALFWSNSIRLDFTFTQRTNEFYNQTGHVDRFGGVNLTFQFF